MKRLLAVLLLSLLFFSPVLADELRPSGKDKCPVCGMFVAGYQDWVAKVEFSDGTAVWYDGVKDMMKYYLDIEKYSPARTQADISSVMVTEYYGLKLTDAKMAYYVLGSEVMGPMGKELVPFKTEEAALEFMRDHKGKAVLAFGEITLETLEELR